MKPTLDKHFYKRQRSRRRVRKARRIGFVLSLTLFIFGGIFFFFTSNKFRVSALTLEGFSRTPEAEVRAEIESWLAGRKAFIVPNSVLWLLDGDDLSTLLKSKFNNLESVTIDRDFPQALLVKGHEYEAWGVICHGVPEKCVWIDQAGVAFNPAPGFSGLVVPKVRDDRDREFILGESQISPKMMALITFFNEAAVRDEKLQSLQFTIDRKDATLRVRTRAGWEILLLEENDPSEAYKNLALTLQNEIKNNINRLDYIDLRFGNRIFYKYR